MTSPLSADGSNFPCRGALKVLGTDEAKPVASWTVGEKYNLTISGGAPHGGGSCQAAISSDQGKTFTVIHTWTGGCPGLDGPNSSFDFRIPSDTPEGELVFAWTWFNRLGNREMYMDCSAIKVSAGSGGSEPLKFTDRPPLFIANINGCKTADNKDVIIPNPGPDVSESGSETAPPTGDCEQASPGSGSPAQSSPGSGSVEATTSLLSAIPTDAPSAVGDDHDSSGRAADPTANTADTFITTSPSTGSDPSRPTEEPSQTGSGSGDIGYEPGSDWPEDFSGTSKLSLSTPLAVLLIFIVIA